MVSGILVLAAIAVVVILKRKGVEKEEKTTSSKPDAGVIEPRDNELGESAKGIH